MSLSTTEPTRGKKGILAALMIGVFLSPINVNFTSVALPTMHDFFSVSVEDLSWIGTAYFIPTVVVMPLLAALGQRWGLRRMYILGFTLLSIGAFLAALAQSFGWLLAARVLQGIGWSGLYPLALILIRKHFALSQQGEVLGLWESAVGFAAIVGPLLGGVLVASLGWPSIYLGIGAIAATGILLGMVYIPEDKQAEPTDTFDWRGALGLMLTVLLFLLGMTRRSLPFLFLGTLALGGWVMMARRTAHPFVQPGMLKNKQFIAAAGAASLRMVIGIACVMSLPLLLEGVQNRSPIIVGLLLPTYSLFLFLGARPGGRWADRAGSRPPGLFGFALMTAGVLMLVFVQHGTGVIFIGVALMIRGVGAGISQSPFAKAATAAFGEEHTNVAAGLYGMVRYSGLAIGSALVGILLDARLANYNSSGRDAAAIPAFQELFLVLVMVGVLGFILVSAIRNDDTLGEPALILPTEAANG